MTPDAMTLKGVIRGKTIELDREPGLPDGEAVTVTLQNAKAASSEELPDNFPWAELWADRLVFDSSVLPGVRIVKGTKLEAEPLVAEIEQGGSDEALLQAHPELTPGDVEALRVYAKCRTGLGGRLGPGRRMRMSWTSISNGPASIGRSAVGRSMGELLAGHGYLFRLPERERSGHPASSGTAAG